MKISFPYTSTEQYLDWLPTYYFDEKNCVDIAAERLNKIADSIENQAKIIMADCGAGPGRVWHLLHPHIHRILAVDPNKNMWRKTPPDNVTYIQEDGLRFMIDYEEHIDLVTFLWSMNYPLLAFFEKYDAEKNRLYNLIGQKGTSCAEKH